MCKVSKTRDQWGKLILYASITTGATILAGKFPALGPYTQLGVASLTLTPLGVYAGRITRYFQNVRFQRGKVIRTGDGGSDYYEVIVKKYWNPFWKAPLDHLKLPINVFVVQVDIEGYLKGGVRAGKMALKAVAGHDKDATPIPHNAKADDDTLQRREYLDRKGTLTEAEKLENYGLNILERDGLKF